MSNVEFQEAVRAECLDCGAVMLGLDAVGIASAHRWAGGHVCKPPRVVSRWRMWWLKLTRQVRTV